MYGTVVSERESYRNGNLSLTNRQMPVHLRGIRLVLSDFDVSETGFRKGGSVLGRTALNSEENDT